MEIGWSETNFSPGIVYFSEHKKSAGSFHSATFCVDWKRVRPFTGSISGPKDWRIQKDQKCDKHGTHGTGTAKEISGLKQGRVTSD